MHLRATLFMAGLAAVVGCSSSGYELQTLYEITQLYGGEGHIQRGYNFSAGEGQPAGSYLEIRLNNPALSRYYDALSLPASNCAYLAYHGLAVAEPDRYAFYKVELTDSLATHTYTYSAADLALAEQASTNLVTLVADWQQHELLAATDAFNPTALGSTPPDSLLPLMARMAAQLAPLERYELVGWHLTPDTLAGKPVQLVELLASVPHPAPTPDGLFSVTINPRLRSNEKFLYGMHLVR